MKPNILSLFISLATLTLANCTPYHPTSTSLASLGQTLDKVKNGPQWEGTVAQLKGDSSCSAGVLADYPQFLTTAAHCLSGKKEVEVIFYEKGQPRSPSLKTSTWHIHPGFTLYKTHNLPSQKSLVFDLALVELPTPLALPVSGAHLSLELPYFNTPLQVVSVGLNPLFFVGHQWGSIDHWPPRLSRHSLQQAHWQHPLPLFIHSLVPTHGEVLCPGDSGAPVMRDLHPYEKPHIVGVAVAIPANLGELKCADGSSYGASTVPLAPHGDWLQALLPQEPNQKKRRPHWPEDGLILECFYSVKLNQTERFLTFLYADGSAHLQWTKTSHSKPTASTTGQWSQSHGGVVVTPRTPWSQALHHNTPLPQGPLSVAPQQANPKSFLQTAQWDWGGGEGAQAQCYWANGVGLGPYLPPANTQTELR